MKIIKQGNNAMELWEVLDDKGNATGEIMEKYDQKVFDRGFYHLGADVWIINSDNKVLIQKRAKQKKLEPNVWAMTGGSVILGENSINTIVREAKEELNIDINADNLKLITKFKTGNVWIDTYILRCDYDISKMKFQEDEVSDVKWATLTEINELVNNCQFIKHRWEFVSKLLEEEIELLNEKSSVAEVQKYIKDMKKARKFDGVTIEREMMLFLEELGELAKAIRKNTNVHLDIAKEYDSNVEEELADCFIYLLSIANMNNVDIFKAFKDKETKNCDRVWK